MLGNYGGGAPPSLIPLVEVPSSIGTFHLPTREMTIIVDIHHLYHLPIQGQQIQHALE